MKKREKSVKNLEIMEEIIDFKYKRERCYNVEY